MLLSFIGQFKVYVYAGSEFIGGEVCRLKSYRATPPSSELGRYRLSSRLPAACPPFLRSFHHGTGGSKCGTVRSKTLSFSSREPGCHKADSSRWLVCSCVKLRFTETPDKSVNELFTSIARLSAQLPAEKIHPLHFSEDESG